MFNMIKKSLMALALSAGSILAVADADACTRMVYKGLNQMVVTGRSMDWREDSQSNIWIFPRGMETQRRSR